MPILTCRKVTFYSQGDEKAFFESIGRIKAVERVEGRRDSILLHVRNRVSQDSLRELIAVFLRYRIRMAQLAQFLSDSNRHWFADPEKTYHKRVFLTSPKKSTLHK
jgi:hypothetical protein